MAILIEQLLSKAYQHSIQSRGNDRFSSQLPHNCDPISLQSESKGAGLLCCTAFPLSQVVYGELLYRALLIRMLTVLYWLFREWWCRSVGGGLKDRRLFSAMKYSQH